jgi:hypothetical protein
MSSKGRFGEKSNAWKGNSTCYPAKHCWIKKHKIKPKCCPKCGSIKNLEWANIDHKYKRNLNDYICLCAKCHYKHDIKNKLRPIYKQDLKTGRFLS